MPWTVTIVDYVKAGGTINVKVRLTDGVEVIDRQVSANSLQGLKDNIRSFIEQTQNVYTLYDQLPPPMTVFDVSAVAPPPSTAGRYVVVAAAMAKAANKNYLTLLNSDAALVVEVAGVKIIQEMTAAVVGLTRGYRLQRITGHSAGTLVTPDRLDSRDPSPPAGITSRKDGVNITPFGGPLGIDSLNEEETGAAGGGVWLFREDEAGGPIVCLQDQGVAVQQDATAGVGLLSALIYYRIQ